MPFRTAKPAPRRLDAIHRTWSDRWPAALQVWSRYVQLREPVWCRTPEEERAHQLTGSFAMIRLVDHTIVISLRQIAERDLSEFATEILAHEIGHHVYCPADLTDNARLIARIRAGLPTKEHLAGFVANLYADLLINDRLQRSAGLNLSGVYTKLGGGTQDRLWTLYLRTYERLWSQPAGQYAHGQIDLRLDQDAQLTARLVRSYSREWLDGAGRFAALCLPYLLEDESQRMRRCLAPWLDTACAGSGQLPDGLARIDPDELEGAIHPAEDPELSGIASDQRETSLSDDGIAGSIRHGGLKSDKIFRSPLEYGEILEAAGVQIDSRQIVARYYRERAIPHLIRFPTRVSPQATDPIPEGLDVWEVGSPVAEIDWPATLVTSSQVIPGITTRRRLSDESPGEDPLRQPVDLYLGVDCSGSMGNPAHTLSYPVLAGSIIALSALRSGARVKVVLSGEPGRTTATDGFVRSDDRVMATLTDYLGTGYAFGIHRLAETFDDWPAGSRPVHLLIVSDNDMFRMLEENHSGRLGWEIAAEAVQRAGGGGTFVLELPAYLRDHGWPQQTSEYLARMKAIGWTPCIVSSMEELVQFARQFSRQNYQRESHTTS
jgi:hypothetical protein